MNKGEIRKSNKLLNAEPKVANFLPQDLFLPLVVCGLIGVIAYKCKMPPFWASAFSLWLGSTYWLFVGKKPWKQLTKILRKQPTWGLARSKYQNYHKDLQVIRRK